MIKANSTRNTIRDDQSNGWVDIAEYCKNDSSEIEFKIIQTLAIKTQKFFNFSVQKRSQRTRLIKVELIKLGHELGFRVYANGLIDTDLEEVKHNFVNREWLYDLHWYTDVKDYMPNSLPLVMECEWDNKRPKDKSNSSYSAVKFDFQKLIVSNASLRLMIFGARQNELNQLGEYFEEAINSYENLLPNSKFLFVSFDNRRRKAMCRILTKSPKA